jgi:hypothetical protein
MEEVEGNVDYLFWWKIYHRNWIALTGVYSKISILLKREIKAKYD